MLFSDTLFLAVFRPWRKSRWHHSKIFHVLSQLATVCNVNRMMASVHIHPLLFSNKASYMFPQQPTQSPSVFAGFSASIRNNTGTHVSNSMVEIEVGPGWGPPSIYIYIYIYIYIHIYIYRCVIIPTYVFASSRRAEEVQTRRIAISKGCRLWPGTRQLQVAIRDSKLQLGNRTSCR